MSHLTEERLFELGVTPDERPTPAEAGHLATCEACAATLAAERALTSELVALPTPEAPVDFVVATRDRFERAYAARHARHTALAFSLAIAAGLAVTLPLFGLVIGSAETLVLMAGDFVRTVATVGRAFGVLLDAVPMIPMLLATLLGGTCALIATLLNRLAVATAAWK